MSTPTDSEERAPESVTAGPKERPILFRPELVREILAGRKTVTRRPVKPQPASHPGSYADLYNRGPEWAFWLPDNRMTEPRTWRCPYGAAGDRLWVRETWGDGRKFYPHTILFRADYPHPWETADMKKDDPDFRWRPSIHLPRRHARLVLDVVSVRVERLHAITEKQARAEGLKGVAPGIEYRGSDGRPSARVHFGSKWGDLYDGTPFAWHCDPWVWVVSFKRAVSP